MCRVGAHREVSLTDKWGLVSELRSGELGTYSLPHVEGILG